MNSSGSQIDDIDGRFVPRPRPDVSYTEIDREIVVAAPISEDNRHVVDSHWLNPIASVIWKAYDGVANIDDLVELLSTAFGADANVVKNDVLTLTRQLARGGLFDGIPAERPTASHQSVAGIPLGTELPFFRMIDIEDREFTADEISGHKSVLVHWSPTCSFCIRLASHINQLQPDLDDGGIALILIATGSVENNRRLRDEAGLTCRILLQSDFQPFEGLGTPVAYLTDESGRVASPLTIGSDGVAGLLSELVARGRQT